MTFRELFSYRVFTISNFLTFSRIPLVAPLWIFLEENKNYLALLIILLMALTDFLDGFLARLLNQQSPLGQYLDPVADKIAILLGALALVIYREYPVWLYLLILARELWGTGMGLFLMLKRNVLGKPNYWGKAGVFVITLSGVFYLLNLPYKDLSAFVVLFVVLGGVAAYSKTYWRSIFRPRTR